MSTVYQVRTYTPAGILTHIITDMLGLTYTREVNVPGVLQVELNGNHLAIADFELDAQIEVWRKLQDQDWYCDFYGLWRGEQRAQTEDGVGRYTLFAVGQLSFLDRVIIAYPAETANRTKFTATAAETIAKTLVFYNATYEGTIADGRARTVTLANIEVDADAGRGNSFDFYCAWNRLLPELRTISDLGNGDFDLVKTKAQEWAFRWYPDQLGTNRSSQVTFATGYGNMANARLTRDYMSQRTVAIVGGQGESSARTVATVNSQLYAAGVNDAEEFVDARRFSTVAGLLAEGDAILIQGGTGVDFTFDVLQTPACRYGVEYFLGDLVTARYEDIVATKKIRRISVSLTAQGTESIVVEMAEILQSTLAVPRVHAEESVYVSATWSRIETYGFEVYDALRIAEARAIRVLTYIEEDDAITVAEALTIEALTKIAAAETITVAEARALTVTVRASKAEAIKVTEARSLVVYDRVKTIAAINQAVAVTEGKTIRVTPAWWLGEDTISAANSLDHFGGYDPTDVYTYTYTGADIPSTFYVAVRTNAVVINTPSCLFSSGGAEGVIGMARNLAGNDEWRPGFGDLIGATLFTTGDHVYIITSSGTSVRFYRDATLIATIAATDGITGSAAKFGERYDDFWPWTHKLIAGTIGDISLSAGQVSGLTLAMLDI